MRFEERFYTALAFGTAGLRGIIGAGIEPHEPCMLCTACDAGTG